MPVDPAAVAAYFAKMEEARKACADAKAAYEAAQETLYAYASGKEAFLLGLCRDPENDASALCGAGFGAKEVQDVFSSLLLKTIFANNRAEMSDLLRRGANVNAIDAFHSMRRSGAYDENVHFREGLNEETEKWLRRGEDGGDHGTTNNSPLHFAAACCNMTICRILLEYVAKASHRNSFGLTALDVAQARGKDEKNSKHQPFEGVLELLRS